MLPTGPKIASYIQGITPAWHSCVDDIWKPKIDTNTIAKRATRAMMTTTFQHKTRLRQSPAPEIP